MTGPTKHTALKRVLETTELLEMILAEVALEAEFESDYNTRIEPIQTLSELKSVNRMFSVTITNSPMLRGLIVRHFSQDSDDAHQADRGVHWLFRNLGIDIEYMTYTDEVTTVVRVLEDLGIGRFTEDDGHEVSRYHRRCYDKFVERHGGPNASWRWQPLRNSDDRHTLLFEELEFVANSASQPDYHTGYRGTPARPIAYYKVHWSFAPDDTVGMFFDKYAEIMARSPQEHDGAMREQEATARN